MISACLMAFALLANCVEGRIDGGGFRFKKLSVAAVDFQAAALKLVRPYPDCTLALLLFMRIL